MKKKIALLLISAMLLPASAISVASEEIIPSIDKNIEADPDGITIYPVADVDTSRLASVTKLTDKDGNEIPIQISKVNNSSKYPGELIQDKPYLIKRADGDFLETNKDYSLSIGEGDGAFKKDFRLELVFSDDFSGEGDNSGADNLKWTWVSWQSVVTNNVAEVVDGELKITMDSASKDPSVQRLVPSDYLDMMDLKSCTAKFDFRADDADNNGAWTSLSFTHSETTADFTDNHTEYELHDRQLRVRVNKSGYDWSCMTNHPDLNAGEMNSYKFTGDGLKYSIYQGEKRLAARSEEDNQYAAQGPLAFRLCGSGKHYTIDNVIVTRMYEYIDVTNDLQEPCDIDQSSVTLTVGDSFDTETLTQDSVSIKAGEEDFTDFTVEAAGNDKIKINFTDKLQYKTKYTISLDNSIVAKNIRKYEYASTEFTTLAPQFDLDSFEEDAGTITAVIKNNRCEDAVSCIATVVCYDENNKILCIRGGKYEIAVGDSATISYAKPDEAARALCFVWDNFTDMNTLLEGYWTFE